MDEESGAKGTLPTMLLVGSGEDWSVRSDIPLNDSWKEDRVVGSGPK